MPWNTFTLMLKEFCNYNQIAVVFSRRVLLTAPSHLVLLGNFVSGGFARLSGNGSDRTTRRRPKTRSDGGDFKGAAAGTSPQPWWRQGHGFVFVFVCCRQKDSDPAAKGMWHRNGWTDGLVRAYVCVPEGRFCSNGWYIVQHGSDARYDLLPSLAIPVDRPMYRGAKGMGWDKDGD